MSRATHQRKLVRALTAEWLERLGLDTWFQVTLKFVDAPEKDDTADEGTAAVCEGDWSYRFCRIRVFLPNILNYNKRDLEQMLVHELCHGLVAPMESHVKDRWIAEREHTVETLARAFLFTKYGRHFPLA